MAGFPAIDLPLHLQERIITKFKWKSYFRLQQTCKYMEELIQTSKHIHVWIPKNSAMRWGGNENGDLDIFWEAIDYPYNLRCLLSPKYFYGAQFAEFDPASTWRSTKMPSKEEVQTLCDSLKKYRITCRALTLNSYLFDKDSCDTLCRVLKPTRICIYDGTKKIYESLKYFNKLEEVDLSIDTPDALPATLLLAPKCENLNISTFLGTENSAETMLNLVLSMLQGLRRLPLHNLKWFKYCVRADRNVVFPCRQELSERFKEFNPQTIFTTKGDVFKCDVGHANRFAVNVPRNVPNEVIVAMPPSTWFQ